MTSLQSDLTHKQPEHDAIAADLHKWLDAGNIIERLGNTPLRKNETTIKFNNRKEEA
ncbi:MAG: hypothetical protein ACTS5I_06810 [Rhodanobacter sp.]